jgi:two-component system LytT family response regulator
MKINAVIIDDEAPARDTLRNFILDYCPEVTIAGMAGNVDEAFDLITRVHPDLVFLDIQMPHPHDGFFLLDRLPALDFRIIFITAHSHYAQRAFRYFAVDYLMKPLSIKELREAVDRVKNDLMVRVSNDNLVALKKHDHLKEGDFDVLILRENSGFRTIEVKDIIMCEADGTYTRFYLTGGRIEIASKNLKFYQETLEEPPFIRIQNSYLINVKHVRRYHQGDHTIYLSEDLTAPLGESYKEKFFTYFR